MRLPGNGSLLRLGILAASLILSASCARDASDAGPLRVAAPGTGALVRLSPQGATGDWILSLPEAIATETGYSALYPVGDRWVLRGTEWIHKVEGDGSFVLGNARRIDDERIEISGIQLHRDNPVRWETRLVPLDRGIEFGIRLTNVGDETIRKAGAHICLSFEKATWWNTAQTFVASGGSVRTLEELGGNSDRPDHTFQIYMVGDSIFDNPFYHEYWGANAHRLDAPTIISFDPVRSTSVVVTTDDAYFVAVNTAHPCTDLMLAFGDLEPGQTEEAGGRVEIHSALPQALLAPSTTESSAREDSSHP